MPEYQSLTDDEVLQFAAERDQLTDEARGVLDFELSRRRLSVKDVHSHEIAYEHAQKVESLRLRRLPPGLVHRYGVGFRFLGSRNLRRDPSGQWEEYDSSRWFVVLWIPVFPIATFTVRRRISRWKRMSFKSDPQIITRHPRDWEQILLTWVKTAAVLLALRLVWLSLIHHPEFVKRIFQ